MNILLEMRPALDGHAGIPQETRLLFRELNALPGVSVDGLIQSSSRVLARGLPARRWGRVTRDSALSIDGQMNRLARVVISMQSTPGHFLPRRVRTTLELLQSGLAVASRKLFGVTEELTHFDASHFRDFIWRALFSKTLDPKDLQAVMEAGFRIATVPWLGMHRFGLMSRPFAGRALYPRLDTRGYDLMIAETPYPGHVARGTRLIVRYHDAIPMLMPHTISQKAFHQASHYQALRANVRAGAWFSCVSDSTRADLLSMFPEVEERSETIHNMISQYYFSEDSSPSRVPEILRMRRHDKHGSARPAETGAPPRYLLMVSTIEPRKNHLMLLAAWERLRTHQFADLKLVLVGALGWDHKGIVRKLKPWLDRDEVVLLQDVPSEELRLLYRHASVTVCPSLYEGFDFSGIEAMLSGGVVAASDIPVHREIYGAASEYFSPYSAEDMAGAIARPLSDASGCRQRLQSQGSQLASRYSPEVLLPRWHSFLERMQQMDKSGVPARSGRSA